MVSGIAAGSVPKVQVFENSGAVLFRETCLEFRHNLVVVEELES
jgi:hypothetical protein